MGEGVAPSYTVHWEKDWSRETIVRPCDCRHPGTAALSINQRLEPNGRAGRKIVLDADICMNCGVDKTGTRGLRDGLELAHAEHGWDVRTGMRLRDLCHFHRSELWRTSDSLSIWMAFAIGLTGRYIMKQLNAAAQAAA